MLHQSPGQQSADVVHVSCGARHPSWEQLPTLLQWSPAQHGMGAAQAVPSSTQAGESALHRPSMHTRSSQQSALDLQ